MGLAGGLNLYGFAGGDPINYSDPFGLCVKDDAVCRRLVRTLRAQGGEEFTKAAARFNAYQGGRVEWVKADDSRLNYDGINTNGDGEDWCGGIIDGGNVLLNQDFSRADALITAVHESHHLEGLSDFNQADVNKIALSEYAAYNELSPDLRRDAVRHSDRFADWWGPLYGTHPVPLKEVKRQ